MAFTDEELAVLAQLAYSDKIVEAGTKNMPLSELLETQYENLRSSLGESYYETIDNLTVKAQSGDYTVVKGVNDKHDTGFAAFAIRDPENHVTVACRGTQGFSLDYDSKKDVYADLQLGISVESGQQKRMEQFMRELNRDGYDGYYFTGHSLGGNLAMHGAISLPDSTKVLGVTTFNAPGFNNGYLVEHNLDIQKIEQRMQAYQNEYDYVSSIFTTPGRTTVVKSAFPFTNLGFDHHGICGFTLGEDGSFVPNWSGMKGVRTGLIDKYLDGPVNLFWSIKTILGYGSYKRNSARNKVRDFSPEVKQMMLNAAKETEEEQWWQLSRWDCWYKVSNFFGTLELDKYAGNVNSYYRKLIDINDASSKTIKQIFETVYSLDESYGAKLRALSEEFATAIQTGVERAMGGR